MSKAERRRTRVSSTIDKLPDDIKGQLDVRLADTSNTYEELAAWLKTEGYEISKSAIGRYAIRTTQAAQRVAPRPRLHEGGVDGAHGRAHAASQHR